MNTQKQFVLWENIGLSRMYHKFSFVHCVPLIKSIHIIYDYSLYLFSILMNLGKIVFQVGCSDKIIQPISSTFILHSCINL